MRIIGGHDYYDSAQAYGHDPNIVFTRGEETLEEKTFKIPYTEVYFVPEDKLDKEYDWKYRVHSIADKSGAWHFYNVRVIFCGVMYFGVKAEYSTSWPYSMSKPTQVFWDREVFRKWIGSISKNLVPRYPTKLWGNATNELMHSATIIGDERRELLKHRVSIAIYDGTQKKWKINCDGLKELQFFRVFDATTAFQELDMWMSGALGMPGNPMVEVSDDIRMQKHGMDKWSFRKKVR